MAYLDNKVGIVTGGGTRASAHSYTVFTQQTKLIQAHRRTISGCSGLSNRMVCIIAEYA